MARLKPYLPCKSRGVPRVDDRRVISGIIHVLKTGCRWKDAPEAYGPRKPSTTVSSGGLRRAYWVDIFHALAASGGPPSQVPIDSGLG